MTKGLLNAFNFFYFRLGKFYQVFKLRNEISLESITNKYISNCNSIIKPFKKSIDISKYENNPILKGGKSRDWDEAGIREPNIIYDGKKYLLYYESRTYQKKKDWQIGVATAPDIIGPWKKYPKNPILKYTGRNNEPDKECIADPCVIYQNGKYHMWFDMFDGETWRIGKAYSNDGLNWKKVIEDGKTKIILDVGDKSEWDHKMIHCPEVFIWENKFHLLYGAQGIHHIDYNTGLAIQVDNKGEEFKKWGQVITDDIFESNIYTSRLQSGIKLNGIIIAGLRVAKLNGNEFTYLVFSDDGGKSWFKLVNQIISPGSTNSWDSRIYYGPNCIIKVNNQLWIGYLGGKDSNYRELGLAYMPLPKIFH
ncbi:MAG: hypothetical protein ACFFDH_12400 [Promethearchaeota archaeon]